MIQPSFSDKDRLTDALNSQKYISDHYNTFANESASPELRGTVMQILTEEHDIQFELFREMSNRGWYPTEVADAQKVTEARNKYQQ